METFFCRRLVIFSQNIPLSQSLNLSSFSAVAVSVANYKSLVKEIVSIPKICGKNLNYPMNESLPLCQTGLHRVGRSADPSTRAHHCEQSVPSYFPWLILTYRNILDLDCNSRFCFYCCRYMGLGFFVFLF